MVMKYIHSNNVRHLCTWLHKYLNLKKLLYIYPCIHWLYGTCIAIVILFSTNIIHLCIILNIIGLNASAIVVLHSGPLTKLEIKYLKRNFCKEYATILSNMGIQYKGNHEYETQLELLINMCLCTCLKLLGIIIIKTFNKNVIII